MIIDNRICSKIPEHRYRGHSVAVGHAGLCRRASGKDIVCAGSVHAGDQCHQWDRLNSQRMHMLWIAFQRTIPRHRESKDFFPRTEESGDLIPISGLPEAD